MGGDSCEWEGTAVSGRGQLGVGGDSCEWEGTARSGRGS